MYNFFLFHSVQKFSFFTIGNRKFDFIKFLLSLYPFNVTANWLYECHKFKRFSKIWHKIQLYTIFWILFSVKIPFFTIENGKFSVTKPVISMTYTLQVLYNTEIPFVRPYLLLVFEFNLFQVFFLSWPTNQPQYIFK